MHTHARQLTLPLLPCVTGRCQRVLLRAVDDDTVRQAPAAEAQRLDLPFESDMKSFTGGSTGSSAAAGNSNMQPQLGPSKCVYVDC